jgi:hypothetical protein
MEFYDVQMLISGVVNSSSGRKQRIGQKLARHLSFEPGPGGSDGSVDGAIKSNFKLLATFQSKLSSHLLGLDEAKILHSDLIRLQPELCIYVAGVGYEASFTRLLTDQGSSFPSKIHLLTLEDVVIGSGKFVAARQDLPAHTGGVIDWSSFLV